MSELLTLSLAFVALLHTAVGTIVPSAFCWSSLDFFRIMTFVVVLSALVLAALQLGINWLVSRFRHPETATTIIDDQEFLQTPAGQYMLELRKGSQ